MAEVMLTLLFLPLHTKAEPHMPCNLTARAGDLWGALDKSLHLA